MFKMFPVYILLLLSSSVLATSVDTYYEIVNSINSVLHSINPSPFKHYCGEKILMQKECPTIFKQFKEDQTVGALSFKFIPPWKRCNMANANGINEDMSVHELEKQMAAEKGLGLKNDYFTQKMNTCFSTKDDKRTLHQKRTVVAMGYNYLNRSVESTKQVSQEIININGILGDKPDTLLPCDKFNMPADLKICKGIKKKCKQTNSFPKYSQELFKNGIEPIIALKKLYKKIDDEGGANEDKKLEEIDKRIDFIENLNPILKSETINNKIDDIYEREDITPNMFENTIKEQLVDSRKKLSKQLDSNINLNNCILYGQGECENLTQQLSKLPPPAESQVAKKTIDSGKLKSEKQIQDKVTLDNYYNKATCLSDMRYLKEKYDDIVTDWVASSALTVLPLGYIKGASKALNTFSVSAAGVNFSKELNKSIAVCKKEINTLEGVNELNSNEDVKCSTQNTSSKTRTVSNYKNCLISLAFAGLDSLPLVPALIAAKRLSKPGIPTTYSEKFTKRLLTSLSIHAGIGAAKKVVTVMKDKANIVKSNISDTGGIVKYGVENYVKRVPAGAVKKGSTKVADETLRTVPDWKIDSEDTNIHYSDNKETYLSLRNAVIEIGNIDGLSPEQVETKLKPFFDENKKARTLYKKIVQSE